MAYVIGGTITNGVVLSLGTQNPTTVTATGYVGNTGTSPSHNGDAIYGQAGTAWTIANQGTIIGNLYQIYGGISEAQGIHLKSGGSITNLTTGRIVARVSGIFIEGGSGTVANLGTILGQELGVGLVAGGSVTNGASGSSVGYIYGAVTGISVVGSPGTIANFGKISSLGNQGIGVALGAGGTVTNGESGGSAAIIYGYRWGVYVGGGSGSVANFGRINDGVFFRDGSGSVANFGTISGHGIYLYAGGTVTNGASGASADLRIHRHRHQRTPRHRRKFWRD